MFNTEEKQKYLLELLKRIAKLNDITIQYSEVMDDHVYLLITFPPRLSITNVVKAFKGASA